MQKHSKFALFILVLGVMGLISYKFLQPHIDDHVYADTSDARNTKGVIKIGMDNWVGYYPLCSKEMRRLLRNEGYRLSCIDDGADYSQRMEGIANGELDFAVASVDAYITSGKVYRYPASIVAVIDESHGGDAIVANTDVVTSINDLKTNKSLSIGYTHDSPSEHLLSAISSHFDLNLFKSNNVKRVATAGSSDALSQLIEGKLDVAVLWEPDVSTALAEGNFETIISTDDTKNLIVDVLLANKVVIKNKPEILDSLLATYFKVLKYYRDNPNVLVKELESITDLPNSQVKQLLNGVRWIGLNDNVSAWFSQSQLLLDTIDSTISIINDTSAVPQQWLPNNDPYRIIHSPPIQTVQQSLNDIALNEPSHKPVSHVFVALSEKQWAHMSEIGTLKTRPVIFSSGSERLTPNGQQQLHLTAESLSHYPNFRILVEGHTGLRGDKALNIELSAKRAKAVKSYLVNQLGFEASRIHAVGKGSDEPLVQLSGESQRRYANRLMRVEIALMSETY
ncbi:nitrate ABC transporter substrate-binding protein [Photobacterium angustum]|uniref:phosphate ABC transporter substrate-binding/OmpA family protein n=1 Tax=Photobacterium angustum TaxID=661 RepID=UPI0005DCE621|nr:phosphate ABC transporter substrate-binding/OmpA family protein [Photobacterium angustum]KJG06883.1 nitrate ABC transporter substrate-binding protein [Photobacterium angustum]PSV94975.1 nitrate ABC transporter substrate-binding protein [Photobacterium angustum]